MADVGGRRRSFRRAGATVAGILVVAGVVLVADARATPPLSHDGRIGPSLGITANGRHLRPAGRLTTLGNGTAGGALTPDGRYYWAVGSGHGINDVHVVRVSDGRVVQVIRLRAASGGIAFAADGRTAVVSRVPVRAGAGALELYSVDRGTGRGVLFDAFELPSGPAARGGTAQAWPQGIALTSDGTRAVVALQSTGMVALVDLRTGAVLQRPVGGYPYAVAVSPDGTTAWVDTEYDGRVSVLDLRTFRITKRIGVGGPNGDTNAHPEGMVLDARRGLLYVAVANRDHVAVVDTVAGRLLRTISVGRPEGPGIAPVAVALAPDGSRVYVADAGEDAVAVLGGDRAVERLIGRIPTAAYPDAVAVSPAGGQLLWVAAQGLGTGPNPDYGVHWADSDDAPYGTYGPDMQTGRLGVLDVPTAAELVDLTRRADLQVRPANAQVAPADTPLVGPGGGASTKIEHVFYVIRENRTYDQVFGTDPRGDGAPALEQADDNGVAGPAGGITPNAHALARDFPLLDHVYANALISRDGHVVTTSGYVTDFTERGVRAGYADVNRDDDLGRSQVSLPPHYTIFDQAVRQGITFRNYGEDYGGLAPWSDEVGGRPTFAAAYAGRDLHYPGRYGCSRLPYRVPENCDVDSGTLGAGGDAGAEGHRFDYYQRAFRQQVATGTVPALTYIVLPGDHTNGTAPGELEPRSAIADNDYGLGQLVDLISHSSVWASSAIFVEEDEAQDGGDHVDSARMPALVISPYARRGAVVHTRYDQESILRTVEMIVGMEPLSMLDAMATPMYDVFTGTPDLRPYTAVRPEQPLDALVGGGSGGTPAVPVAATR